MTPLKRSLVVGSIILAILLAMNADASDCKSSNLGDLKAVIASVSSSASVPKITIQLSKP